MFWYIFGTTERQSLTKWNYRNGNFWAFLCMLTWINGKWMFPSKVFTTKWATMVPSFLGLGSVRSINGVAEMKNLDINIKSNNRKLCQQRAQQSFIKHFNVLPVIGHFFSSFFENFHDIPPPLQNLSMKHWKKYIWNIWSIWLHLNDICQGN